jgi:hypothetical protein
MNGEVLGITIPSCLAFDPADVAPVAQLGLRITASDLPVFHLLEPLGTLLFVALLSNRCGEHAVGQRIRRHLVEKVVCHQVILAAPSLALRKPSYLFGSRQADMVSVRAGQVEIHCFREQRVLLHRSQYSFLSPQKVVPMQQVMRQLADIDIGSCTLCG